MSTKQKNVVKKEKRTVQKDNSVLHDAKIAGICNENKAENSVLPELNAALAVITAAIEELSTQSEVGSRKSEVGSKQSVASNLKLPTDNFRLPTNNSLSKIGPNPLPAPTLVIMSVSSNSILVDWDKVANANGYIIEVANDSLFTNPVSLTIAATETSWNIDGLNANTTYYIRVMATGTGANANSGYSNVQSITTLNDGPGGMSDGMVGDLQHWMDELQTLFQNVATLVPQLDNTVLSSVERRRVLGSGVRRYGHIEKVYEVSQEFPQFWPAFLEDGKLNERIREIDVLRNLLILFQYYSRVVGDLLLLAGHDAFRMANSYYTTVRDAARRGVPEAVQVFDRLQLFWKRRRRTTEEPTVHELERDVHALLHGTKDGMISVSNESDQVVKGEKVFVDHTFPKPRGGMKVVESAQSAE